LRVNLPSKSAPLQVHNVSPSLGTTNGSKSAAVRTYDVENRLTAYGSALTNGYRGDGLRAWKQPSGGSKTYFLYDGTEVVCELDSSGNLAAHSTFGAGGLISRRVGSTTTWYAHDPHGSVSLTLDGNGDAVSKHGWDAYGTSLGTAPSGPFGYGAAYGYYTDSETGLCALAFRHYDPERGRFLNRDPIGYSGGVNLYGYVGNSPVGGVDPLGLAAVTVSLGGVAVGGFGRGMGVSGWAEVYVTVEIGGDWSVAAGYNVGHGDGMGLLASVGPGLSVDLAGGSDYRQVQGCTTGAINGGGAGLLAGGTVTFNETSGGVPARSPLPKLTPTVGLGVWSGGQRGEFQRLGGLGDPFLGLAGAVSTLLQR
jgi:RHS repeat-associated protein